MVIKPCDERGGGRRDPGGGGGDGPVPSLLNLSLLKVQRLLTAAVRRSNWHKSRATLTHAVLTHVPHNLRQELQNRVLHDWRLYDTISLRLLELLLSPATSSLRLAHVRVFYRDSFLGLLHRLTGLQELAIQDPVWSFSGQQAGVLSEALSRMAHLRVLALHHCGHNALLAAVAAHCPLLQVVSVRGSRAVSDAGVWSLVTLPVPPPPPPPPPAARPAHTTTTSSSSSSSRVVRGSWYTALKTLTSLTLSFRLTNKQGPDDRPDGDDPGGLLYPGRPTTTTTTTTRKGAARGAVSLSPCCASLALVDVRCTGVTSGGVSLLTQALAPHAHILHDAQQH